jgi:hypothetical protein
MVIAGIATAQLAVGGSVAAVALSSSGSPAFADAGGYGTQPGYSNAITHSGGCAGAGAFGAFGTYGNAPHDFGQSNPNGPGANGSQTGYNNSNNCGNPQGNP